MIQLDEDQTESVDGTLDIAPAEDPRGIADGIPVWCNFDAIVPVEDLRPNPLNPNTHSEDQIYRLGEIIEENGWRHPITVSKRSGLITKGWGRLLAALLKMWEEVPVEYQYYRDEAHELADMVADNRIQELSTTDYGKLESVMPKIEALLPPDAAGYTQKDLDSLLIGLDFGSVPALNDSETPIEETEEEEEDRKTLICPECGAKLKAKGRIVLKVKTGSKPGKPSLKLYDGEEGKAEAEAKDEKERKRREKREKMKKRNTTEEGSLQSDEP
jgi:hypothetical protein